MIYLYKGLKKERNMSESRTLVAYYSYSGNTKAIAEKISELTGGDLFEIKTVKEYPRNYNDIVNLVKTEKEENSIPELADNGNISDYDTIYIGTPVWWYTLSTPVKAFLTNNNFTGKTIKPFCTHGGGGESSTYVDIEKLCPDAEIESGFTSYENSAKAEEIENWINS